MQSTSLWISVFLIVIVVVAQLETSWRVIHQYYFRLWVFIYGLIVKWWKRFWKCYDLFISEVSRSFFCLVCCKQLVCFQVVHDIFFLQFAKWQKIFYCIKTCTWMCCVSCQENIGILDISPNAVQQNLLDHQQFDCRSVFAEILFWITGRSSIYDTFLTRSFLFLSGFWHP